MTFVPFKHCAGDLYQRIGGSNGFHWRHISRDMAFHHVVDLVSEANAAEGMGDTIHAKRLANSANCLLGAIVEHDDWRKASTPYPAANQNCLLSPANNDSKQQTERA